MDKKTKDDIARRLVGDKNDQIQEFVLDFMEKLYNSINTHAKDIQNLIAESDLITEGLKYKKELESLDFEEDALRAEIMDQIGNYLKDNISEYVQSIKSELTAEGN